MGHGCPVLVRAAHSVHTHLCTLDPCRKPTCRGWVRQMTHRFSSSGAAAEPCSQALVQEGCTAAASVSVRWLAGEGSRGGALGTVPSPAAGCARSEGAAGRPGSCAPAARAAPKVLYMAARRRAKASSLSPGCATRGSYSAPAARAAGAATTRPPGGVWAAPTDKVPTPAAAACWSACARGAEPA